MPTHTVSNGPTFSYHDTEAPLGEKKDYNTLIILHGLTFNASLFERLFPLAREKGFRIISINRRPYSGSTRYSDAELLTIREGTLNQKSNFWDSQGRYLAQLISDLIAVLDLGKVALVGWSLGSSFILFILNACSHLDPQSQERLVEHVYSVIMWDPPSTALGFEAPPGAYIPLFDESIPREDRPRRFSEYVSSYFTHKGSPTNSADWEHLLNYQPDPNEAPSVNNMSPEELRRIVDGSAPASGDSAVGELSALEDGRALLQSKVRNALLNIETRDLWKHTTFSCLYGDRNAWYIPVTLYGLQRLLKEANDPRLSISFKVMKGANHLVMWDRPEVAIQGLLQCM